MKKSELLIKINNFESALQRLNEALAKVKDDLHKDGVIKRFEFTVELLWKTLKAILKYKGIECYSPRDCIKLSFKAKIIDDDEILFDMLEDRNKSSHVYDQKLSDEIFQRIKEVYIEYLNNLDLKRRI